MYSGDWLVYPPRIVAFQKGLDCEVPSSVITRDVYIKIESEPENRIFFTTDNSTPVSHNKDPLAYSNTHRYKAPFKLTPGIRTIKAIAVSRVSGEQSAIASNTFEVVEDDYRFTNGAQINDMYRSNMYEQPNGYMPDIPYTEVIPTNGHSELEQFFSTENTQRRIASLAQELNAKRPVPNTTIQPPSIYDDSRMYSHSKTSPTTRPPRHSTNIKTTATTQPPRYSNNSKTTRERQSRYHQIQRGPAIKEISKERSRLTIEDEEQLLEELERKYKEEKLMKSVEMDDESDTARLLATPKTTDYLNTVQRDMRERDVLAQMSGNEVRYSQSREAWMNDDRKKATHKSKQLRHKSRSRSRSPSKRKKEKTSSSSSSSHSSSDENTSPKHEKTSHKKGKKVKSSDLEEETLTELERELEEYKKTAKLRYMKNKDMEASSVVSSEVDELFSDRGRESRRDQYNKRISRSKENKNKENLKEVKKEEKKTKDKDTDKKGEKDKEKHKKEKEKKDKKKKRSKSRSSSTSSSSTSSSSSSSSSESDSRSGSEGDHSKKKKKKKKDKKEKEKKGSKEKSLKEEKTSQASEQPASGIKATPKTRSSASYIPPNSGRTDASSSVSSVPPSIKVLKPAASLSSKTSDVSRKQQQMADRALSFRNDSGTQINFWGAPPKEVVDSMKGMFPRMQTQPNSPSTQHQKPHSRPQLRSQVNGYANKRDQLAVPTQHGNQSVRSSLRSESPRSVSAGSVASHTSSRSRRTAQPVISRNEQTEQQVSITGFFKKVFKGWGSSEKEEKSKEKRQTVRSTEDKTGITYQQIKRKWQKKGQLFEDPDFPCDDSSLYFDQKPVNGQVEWKRPSEICSNPEMFVGGASRFDIKQGVLGNCWLLAAIASLTSDQKLLFRVVPQDQSFNRDYAGIFRFVIWQYGRWVEVCVDDRLPTYKGKLIYMHSTDSNEFWSSLLEKAYAKLCGCYENLTGGLQSEAMTDFTGGVCERYNFREELPDDMFSIMYKAKLRGALMGCSIDVGAAQSKALPGRPEEELENGLIVGHAYSITDVMKLKTTQGVVELVRCRNPWGSEHEWKGAWSDQSEEWQSISEEQKAELGLNFDHDGEFWMDWRDFSANFQRVEVCNLGPDDLTDDTDDQVTWRCQVLHGCWKRKVNAGGCRNFPKTFYMNPQYRVELHDVDVEDDQDLCTVIVALMQKGRRKYKKTGGGNLTIGFEIYNVDGVPSGNLDKQFFRENGPVATSPQYINMREIVGRYRLEPGQYAIIPTTFEADEEADFVIRVFTENDASQVIEADEPTCLIRPQSELTVQAGGITRADEAEARFTEHGGEDHEIDAHELKDLLNQVFTKDFAFGEFDLGLSRSLVATHDGDSSGKLTLQEFRKLWDELQTLKFTFKKYDYDQSGYFNSTELREALKASGFQVSNALFNQLVYGYSDKKGNINFNDFVSCNIVLKKSFATFQAMSEGGEEAKFTQEAYLQMTV